METRNLTPEQQQLAKKVAILYYSGKVDASSAAFVSDSLDTYDERVRENVWLVNGFLGNDFYANPEHEGDFKPYFGFAIDNNEDEAKYHVVTAQTRDKLGSHALDADDDPDRIKAVIKAIDDFYASWNK